MRIQDWGQARRCLHCPLPSLPPSSNRGGGEGTTRRSPELTRRFVSLGVVVVSNRHYYHHSVREPILTETTQSGGDDPASSRPEQALALRWVFPLPAPAPVWPFRERVSLGRSSHCSVQLPSALVSRQHAELCPSGPLWLIADLASKNGTFVNGKRVTSAVLSRGDVLRIGDFVAVVVIGSRGTALHFQSFGHGIGGGHLHAGAVKFVEELARVDLPVVLEGETGTGKERFARALHATSGRKGPFLAVNCAVYSKAVAAGELFGYRRGAFTGADQASLGHIRAAEGGTLLLDELVELSLDVQAMLLRALENREVLPLGETRPVP